MHHRADLLGRRDALGRVHARGRRGHVAGDRARARPRYGDGSRQNVAITPSSRSWAAAESARARGERRRDRPSRAAGPAPPCRGSRWPGQEDGRLHASTSSGAIGGSARAHRVEAAVDMDDLAVIARAASREQEVDRAGDRRRVLDVPAQRRLTLPGVARSPNPGMPRAANVPSGPARNQVHAHAARAEVARQVARGRLQRGLGDAHPVVDRPGDLASKSSPTIDAPSSGNRSDSPTASAFSEYADVWNAVIALSGGVLRKLPPSASSGAKAIACRMPSTRPQRSRRSSATASMSSGLLTSSSRTSGAGSSLVGGAVGHALRAAEAGQHDLRAGRLRLAGDLERDRLAIDDAGDQELLALQKGHSPHSVAGRADPPGASPREPHAASSAGRRCGRRTRTRSRSRAAGLSPMSSGWASFGHVVEVQALLLLLVV